MAITGSILLDTIGPCLPTWPVYKNLLKVKEIFTKTFPCFFMVFMVSKPSAPPFARRTGFHRLPFIIFTHIAPCPAPARASAAPVVMRMPCIAPPCPFAPVTARRTSAPPPKPWHLYMAQQENQKGSHSSHSDY